MSKIKKRKINQLLIDLGFDDVKVDKDMSKSELKLFLKNMGFSKSEVDEIISEF